MPIVRESIEEETGIVPSSEVHPDEAVAIGAAYYVLDALKTEKKKVEKGESDNKQVLNAAIPETSKKYTFTDVTSHGIGIVCTGDNDLEFNSVIATKFAEEAIEGKVNDVSAYDLLVHCYFENGIYEKALDIVDKGLAVFARDLNLHWLGARIATIGTQNFEEAQQRVNALLELAPDKSIGHSEQIYLHLRKGDEDLAFQEIDSYITAHPDDEEFKQGVAYDLDAYSNTCYYYDAAQNASFIADKTSYEKCLALRSKAVEIFEDEHTQNQLERAKYYGQKEWNDWNMPAIKSLALYGTIFTIIGFAADMFLAFGIVLYAVMGVLIYFSFRPYWQINKTYVTGEMGTAEKIINRVGDATAQAAIWGFQAFIKFMGIVLKFIFVLASGKWLDF